MNDFWQASSEEDAALDWLTNRDDDPAQPDEDWAADGEEGQWNEDADWAEDGPDWSDAAAADEVDEAIGDCGEALAADAAPWLAVTELEHQIPEVLETLQADPEAVAALQALTGVDISEVAPDDQEAWPAIVGAALTALPYIIKAAPAVVKAVQGLAGRRRRPARGRRPSAPRRTATRRRDDATAAALRELSQLLTQLTPLLTRLGTQAGR